MNNLQRKKIVVFGSSGKLGTSLTSILGDDTYELSLLQRSDCDVRRHDQVLRCIEKLRPDLIINAAAFNGIDACEKDPHQAMEVNTLFPKLLAELSVSHSFILVHISSDAVFSGTSSDCYNESSIAQPINMYGFTKYGADCFITAIAERYYIARISVQFGVTNGKFQFVEKMVERIQQGTDHILVSDDIISSPSYSKDIAIKIRELIYDQNPFGLYHISNEGKASLFELMTEIVKSMDLNVSIEPVSHRTFSSLGLKNIHTPICSEKIPPLRPWKDALLAYCLEIQAENKGLIHG